MSPSGNDVHTTHGNETSWICSFRIGLIDAGEFVSEHVFAGNVDEKRL